MSEMTPERWERIKEIFDQAVELAGPERGPRRSLTRRDVAVSDFSRA
jgi:hypothetical protein